MRKILTGLMTVLPLLALWGCKSPTSPLPQKTFTVTYSVTGNDTGLAIAYIDSSGHQPRLTGENAPWTFSFTRTTPFVVGVSAATTDLDTLTVTILIDGQTYQQSKGVKSVVLADSTITNTY